ncbi:ATP-binding protein [Streptomyces gamaensis]|uniref:ATP-binding protein n=1 Tax=Streptomyces gamaensis TaxID=1763542 RepID=A0ABW0Z2C6_9ACTN
MATPPPDHPWSYTLNLPHDPRSARIARVMLRGVLESHDVTERADDAVLLTNEMVTHSYRYSDGPVEVRVRELPRERLRISVWDTDPSVPAPFDTPPCRGAGSAPGAEAGAEAGADGLAGGGLQLVCLCADAWGSFTFGGSLAGPALRGKLLWCELGPRSGRVHLAA